MIDEPIYDIHPQVKGFRTYFFQKRLFFYSLKLNLYIYHEKNTIDKRSYEVSIKTSKNLFKKINFNQFTNKSILETFKKIKRDSNPFSKNKITLSVYKDFLKKNKI